MSGFIFQFDGIKQEKDVDVEEELPVPGFSYPQPNPGMSSLTQTQAEGENPRIVSVIKVKHKPYYHIKSYVMIFSKKNKCIFRWLVSLQVKAIQLTT